jgi:hypothetical protein
MFDSHPLRQRPEARAFPAEKVKGTAPGQQTCLVKEGSGGNRQGSRITENWLLIRECPGVRLLNF